MSLETIDLMREQRTAQIEESPASETFQIVGGSTFKGVFDRANFSDSKDKGNVKNQFLRPCIMVSVVPSGIEERTTKIQREEGSEYTLFFIGKDDEGIPLLWLY